MVTMDDYNFIRTILQAKRKELSRDLEKAKSAKEKECSLRKDFYERLSFYGDECDE